MTDSDPVRPHYREMVEEWNGRPPKTERAVSESHKEELEMDEGARWSLEATKSVYWTGGNEGDWDPAYHPDDPVVGPDPDLS